MTPERVVLDTDIVIHLLKKQPEIVARFLALLEAKTAFLISPLSSPRCTQVPLRESTYRVTCTSGASRADLTLATTFRGQGRS